MSHKHADVLRAIADGASIDEFECRYAGWADKKFEPLQWRTACVLDEDPQWEIRRKPQYIMVNGFKVPKPLDVMPEEPVFSPDFANQHLADVWSSVEIKQRLLKYGIAHSTREAAIAHAKAMLGIDPEA